MTTKGVDGEAGGGRRRRASQCGEQPRRGRIRAETAHDGPVKVAVVDDDRSVRTWLREVLENEGFAVILAANGLRLVSTLQVDRPDIILLDVVNSWIDGFELCRALKKNPQFCDIPVIFLSGRSAQPISTMVSRAAPWTTSPSLWTRGAWSSASMRWRRRAPPCRAPWPEPRDRGHRASPPRPGRGDAVRQGGWRCGQGRSGL